MTLGRLALFASVALLAACGKAPSQPAIAPDHAPLADARIGGDFTLTDQDGRKVRWHDFKGRYRLVYFGYTYCPDVCPVDLQKIAAGLRAFERSAPARGARVQPIFITVDPARDTPAVLKTYAAAFHPRLIGLTGSPDAIAAVARAFAVFAAREDASGASGYLMSHSRTPYLFGPTGRPIALVPVDEPGTAADEGSATAVARFLDAWVR